MDYIEEISLAEFRQSTQSPTTSIEDAMELDLTPLSTGREPTDDELEYIHLFTELGLNWDAAISALDDWSWLQRPLIGRGVGPVDKTFYAKALDRAIRYLVGQAPKLIAQITDLLEAEVALEKMGLNSATTVRLGLDPLPEGQGGWMCMGLLAWAIQAVTMLHDEYLVRITRRESIVKGLGKRVIKDKETLEGDCICGICRDDKVAGELVCVLECEHWFDEDCIVEWLMEHDICPACRRTVMVDV